MKTTIKNAVWAIAAGVLVLVGCQDPQNPFTQEENTNISFINDKKQSDSVWTISLNDTLTLRVIEEQLKYIDSIKINFGTDTAITIKKDVSSFAWEDTATVKYLFSSVGSKTIIGEIYYNGRISAKDTINLKVKGIAVKITGQSDTIISVNQYQPVSMCITATGTGPLTYDWYFKVSLKISSTNKCLDIASAEMSDSGYYYCVVKNPWGAPDTSKKIKVNVAHVNKKPVLTAIPDTIIITEGDTLKLHVTSTDADGDSIHLSTTGIPLNSRFADSLNGNGLLEWPTTLDDSGSYPISVYATDGYLIDSLHVLLRVNDNYTGYKISCTAGLGGRITPQDSVKVPRGASETVKITADTGYHIKEVTVNDSSVGPVDSVVLENIKKDYSLIATFNLTDYTVTMANDGHGTTTPSDTQNLKYQAKLTIAATPSNGYSFVKWVITGKAIVDDSTGISTIITVLGPATIMATFAPTAYTLTVNSAGNGTTTPSGARNTAMDTPVNITATPAAGYAFVKWSRSGPEAKILDSGSATTSVTISANATVTASFIMTKYALTVLNNGNGSTNPSGVDSLAYGSKNAVYALAESGYHFVKWVRSGPQVVLEDSLKDTTNVTLNGNGSITAHFAINRYILTVTNDGNGTTTPTGIDTVNHEASTGVKATPTNGFHFVKWSKTGAVTIADSTSDSTTVILMGNGTITAIFTQEVYTLSLANDGHGTTTPASTTPATRGAPVNIAATASSGYHFSKWSKSGAQVVLADSTSSSTTATLTANGTLTANFSLNNYTLTMATGGNGTTTPSGARSTAHAESVNISANPLAGYHFVRWTRSGPEAAIGDSTLAATTATVTGNVTVTALFALNTYSLTISSGGNGTASPAGTTPATHGVPVTIAGTPSAGYHLLKWTRSGPEASIGDSTAANTTVSLTGSTTVTANFAINTYTLTVTSGGNGTVTPLTATTVNHGVATTITATPIGGYHFVKWTRSGLDVTIVDSTLASTTTALSASGTVVAVFAINTYTLTASSTGNGTVTPATPMAVNYGASTAITATPITGYHFVRWTRSRQAVTITDSTLASTTAILTDSGTVTAIFAINKYILTATSGGNGSVTPSTPVSVNHGASTPITATQINGYHFVRWTRSRSAVTISDSTLASTSVVLTDSGTVTAYFAVNTYTLTMATYGQGTTIPAVGNATVSHGASTNISATGVSGYYFDKWLRSSNGATIGDSTKASTTVSLTGNATITAVFSILTDNDGNTYKTVVIGNQTWMAENLREVRFNDGTYIPFDTSFAGWQNATPPRFCYYNNSENVTTNRKYGGLYNWAAVNTGKLAPPGWHVPTIDEWHTLFNALASTGQVAKSLAAKETWNSESTIGTPGYDTASNNSSGFSAYAGGYRYMGYFDTKGSYGNYWSTAQSDGNATFITIASFLQDVQEFTDYQSTGASVRFIKDN